jgi:hypothetical protein
LFKNNTRIIYKSRTIVVSGAFDVSLVSHELPKESVYNSFTGLGWWLQYSGRVSQEGRLSDRETTAGKRPVQ